MTDYRIIHVDGYSGKTSEMLRSNDLMKISSAFEEIVAHFNDDGDAHYQPMYREKVDGYMVEDQIYFNPDDCSVLTITGF
jgi:hypothetical protein